MSFPKQFAAVPATLCYLPENAMMKKRRRIRVLGLIFGLFERGKSAYVVFGAAAVVTYSLGLRETGLTPHTPLARARLTGI